MIKGFEVRNPKNETLYLELANPEKSGLVVEKIDGLGPEKSNIHITDLATVDGGLFTGARRPVRNIVIHLRMMFIPLIEDSRLKLYRYFPQKKKVILTFFTDNRRAEITGYVESIEPDIFSPDEAAQVSILCPDPNFYLPGGEYELFMGVKPMFEFPFSNESPYSNLLEMGIVMEDDRVTFEYEGDADTGMIITIHFIYGGADNITIWNVDTREKMAIDSYRVAQISGGQSQMGDDIIISTITGHKSVQLLREGKYYNIIGAVDKDADWFQISNGPNTFTFEADNGLDNVIVLFSYKTAYCGI